MNYEKIEAEGNNEKPIYNNFIAMLDTRTFHYHKTTKWLSHEGLRGSN